MLPGLGTRSPLFALAVSAGFVLVFIFGFLAWQSPPQIPTLGNGHVEVAPISIHEILRLLYSPLKVAPDAPEVSDESGTKFTLPPNPRYRKKLGKKILVLDLETRSLPSTEDYNKGAYDWRSINHVSGGVFSHYAYAQIHGYDYKFIQAQNFEDRHATWIKPSALANELKNYKWIVFLDADATFRFMHLPIEWMLNYWKIEPQHSITMALDPWEAAHPEGNSDRFNRTYTNTGFMVVQNNKETPEILKAWHECPDDTRYKGCSEWKEPKFHEQSAFGEFIRYDYGDNIKELPCQEANGYPGVTVSNCTGNFVRHYWFNKHNVKGDFSANMMQALTLPIQRTFAENTGGVIVHTGKNEIHS